jgi:hypothetical protein
LSSLDGLLWLLVTLAPLLALQRGLHREIQAVLLILTRRPSLAVALFSLLFFPGVLLHELSHFVLARLLRVPTGRFSVLPRPLPDGRLQLGYVEVARSDPLRDALVGAAPLMAGGLFVAYAAVYHLHMLTLWDFLRAGTYGLFWTGLGLLPTYQDFPLWFYLTFTVSSTMLPSASDRQAWLPLGLAAAGLLLLALLAGAGPWMLAHLAPPFNAALRGAAAVFGLSAAVHLVLVLPVALLHRVLTGVTGLDVSP